MGHDSDLFTCERTAFDRSPDGRDEIPAQEGTLIVNDRAVP
jgi:hypothetical protein